MRRRRVEDFPIFYISFAITYMPSTSHGVTKILEGIAIYPSFFLTILFFEFAKIILYKEDLKNSGDKDRKYFNRPSEVTRFTLHYSPVT